MSNNDFIIYYYDRERRIKVAPKINFRVCVAFPLSSSTLEQLDI